MKKEKNLCDKCIQPKTEYLGLNGISGDSSNTWECLNKTCEKDAQDLLDLIAPDAWEGASPCREISLSVPPKKYSRCTPSTTLTYKQIKKRVP